MNFLSGIAKTISNIPGWQTNRKLVIIESDDWGSIRMPSLSARNKLMAKGAQFSNLGYDDVDTLASEEDLVALFDILCKYKDSKGNYPVITANTVVANPCFNKIEESNFKEYYYEPFTDTLKQYYPNQNVFSIWEQGLSEGIFHPQFHAREHLCVLQWLHALQNDALYIRDAFNEKLWCVRNKVNFSVTYNYSNEIEKEFVLKSIKQGLDLFEKIFGYHSKSMIAPCYSWSSDIEDTAKDNGIEYLQGGVLQKNCQGERIRKVLHYTGQKNHHGQIYLVRNALFEPTQLKNIGTVAECLKSIDTAFSWKKPAIISAHRLNFIGTLDEKNRTNTLSLLTQLLNEIVKKYPEVEFISSDSLGDIIANKA